MEELQKENNIDLKANILYQLDEDVKKLLLKDHSSKKNIIWATDNYQHKGKGYGFKEHITLNKITGKNCDVIKPRTKKSAQEQAKRVKDKAEVFTPSWICNQMANHFDSTWFEKENVFNTESGNSWTTNHDKIDFNMNKTWQEYVNLKILEITCGEAPFLVSRYNTVTGEAIAINNRIGLLDRKLRIINENVHEEDKWFEWVRKAYKAVFAYEWQGDSLLIARENLLYTFIDYYMDKFNREPDKDKIKEIAEIVVWNVWQMDGLKYVVPDSCNIENSQLSIFIEDNVCTSCVKNNNRQHRGIYSKVKNWRTNRAIKFYQGEKKMKFDFVIGNPPYQENIEHRGEQPPIYHLFYDAAFKTADIVMLITPGRFLFNVGKTPSAWNEKMLNDEHYKVIQYYPNSRDVFPSVDIKGGVAIGYRDIKKNFGAIGTYTQNNIIKSILNKVLNLTIISINTILYANTSYRYSNKFFEENPDFIKRVSGGSARYLSSSVFDKFPEVFYEQMPNDGYKYAKILGRQNNDRVYYYFREDYLIVPENYDKYKVFLPSSNGSGAIGEVFSTPLVGAPLVGATETFISFGSFTDSNEANALLKYIKTKFSRMMLGTKKVTQGNKNASTWSNVPLQDFTENSDIDWSKSIHEIDLQLYKKYNLDEKEIEFIEKHVKEMV